jgi:hypothetical protein
MIEKNSRKLSVKEKRIRNKSRLWGFVFGVVLVSGIYIMIHLEKKRLQTEIEGLKRSEGHLKSEGFQLENRLNRYEITLEHFREEDSSLATKFENYMSQHTE